MGSSDHFTELYLVLGFESFVRLTNVCCMLLLLYVAILFALSVFITFETTPLPHHIVLWKITIMTEIHKCINGKKWKATVWDQKCIALLINSFLYQIRLSHHLTKERPTRTRRLEKWTNHFCIRYRLHYSLWGRQTNDSNPRTWWVN